MKTLLTALEATDGLTTNITYINDGKEFVVETTGIAKG